MNQSYVDKLDLKKKYLMASESMESSNLCLSTVASSITLTSLLHEAIQIASVFHSNANWLPSDACGTVLVLNSIIVSVLALLALLLFYGGERDVEHD